MLSTFSDKANFIWSIADLIRDTFKRGHYQDDRSRFSTYSNPFVV